METQKVVAVSGGFDPIHPGHIRLMQEAKHLAGKDGRLLVILNNDNWLRAKKGFSFMDEEDRFEVLMGLECVDDVAISFHDENPEDMSVAPELRMYRPDIFVNAGDRTDKNTPEMDVCNELGIEMVFNATDAEPYDGHSSELLKDAMQFSGFEKRPWGAYKVHIQGEDWTLKTLHFAPGEMTSLQYHEKRNEFWFLVAGKAEVELDAKKRFPMVPFHSYVMVNHPARHRIIAGEEGCVIVEVMQGQYDEEDITRLDDKYGRT